MLVVLAAAPFAAPVIAAAQTPRDVANLVWGSDRPAVAVSVAPRRGQVAGAGSAADLARLSGAAGGAAPLMAAAVPQGAIPAARPHSS
jgi:hypothetical protein